MERKHFLKNGLAALGLAAIAPLANACKKETDVTDTDTDTSSGSGSCTVSPAETEGPFPTKTPNSLVRTDNGLFAFVIQGGVRSAVPPVASRGWIGFVGSGSGCG